jgi:hypothetical protein
MKRIKTVTLLIGLFMLSANILLAQKAIDFFQLQGNSEALFLRIISEADAVSAGNGVVKIHLPDGSTGAADLVATTNPDASELRIRTGYGTMAWRKETFHGKAYGGNNMDIGFAIAPSYEGGYVIGGLTTSYGAGGYDFYFLNIAEDGDFNWGKAYGYWSSNLCRSVIQTNFGGYLLTGHAFNPTYNSAYAYIYHLDASGNILLEGGLGTQTGSESGYDGIQTSDNNFVIVGEGGGQSPNYYDLYVKKVNHSTGSNIWGWTIGTTSQDKGTAIVQRPDGGYVAVGRSYFGSGADIYFLLLNSGGTSDLSLLIGGSGDEEAFDIIISSDGNYVIAGSNSTSGAGGDDFHLRKHDTNGDYIWVSTVGGNLDDCAHAVVEADGGGFLGVGYTYSFGAGDADVWLVKTDDSGNPLWSWVFGGTDRDIAYDLYQDDAGCIIVTGETSSYGAGDKDALLVKFAPDGSTCLGYEVGFGTDVLESGIEDGKFTATRVDDFQLDRNPLSVRQIKVECKAMKNDINTFNQKGKDASSITPTVTTICN